MARAFNPGAWVEGVTYAHVADYVAIALDLYTRGATVDGGGYGRSNTAYVVLVPGAKPGTTYTVTAASWSGGTATVTIGGHVVAVNQLVTITGASPSGYNVANAKITAVTSTTVSFLLVTNPGAWVSGGSLLVGVTPGYGMVCVDENLNFKVHNGSSWVAATTAATAGIWYSASGVPSGGLGSNGDMYLNVTTGDVYGPKTAGSWGAIAVNIKGPIGLTGPAGASYVATSTTSLVTAGSGSKAFTTQSGLAYAVGSRIRATSTGTGQYMEGVVTAYSGTTLTVTMDRNSGTGTHTDWNISLAGDVGSATGVADPGANGIVNRTGIGTSAVADLTGGSWTALTLQNSWVAYSGAPFPQPEYRKFQYSNLVQIHGIIKNGTTTAATVIATLPAGFRPLVDTPIVAFNGAISCLMWFRASGDIQIYGVTTSGDLEFSAWITTD